MAVKVISLRSMTKTVCKALVETEAVFVFVLHWVCAFLYAYGFGRVPRVIYIWQWLHQLGMKMVAASFNTLGYCRHSIHWEGTGSINRHLGFL